MEQKNVGNMFAELNKILLVFCLLAIPTIYVGYRLQVKPEIWGAVAAVVCFLVSWAVVKLFFSKKT